MPTVLCSLLQFPPTLQLQGSPPQEFALQFWNQQKFSNASLVIGIMGMLIGSKGSSVSGQACPCFNLYGSHLTEPGDTGLCSVSNRTRASLQCSYFP